MRRGLRDVVGVVADVEQAAVDFRVQRFHPPVEHLGEAGESGDFGIRDALGGEQFGGAAGGDDFDAQRHERTGERDEAGLVRNGNKGAPNRLRGIHEGADASRLRAAVNAPYFHQK